MANMTELGIYILGAVALAILAAAGIAAGNHAVVADAVLASGAAYLSQLGAFATASGNRGWSVALNGAAMLVAFGFWAVGAFLLL